MERNLFTKEVINGKLVEVREITVRDMLRIGVLKCEDYEKPAYLMSEIAKIDGEKINPKDFLDSNEIEVFGFISAAITAMAKNNLF